MEERGREEVFFVPKKSDSILPLPGDTRITGCLDVLFAFWGSLGNINDLV